MNACAENRVGGFFVERRGKCGVWRVESGVLHRGESERTASGG